MSFLVHLLDPYLYAKIVDFKFYEQNTNHLKCAEFTGPLHLSIFNRIYENTQYNRIYNTRKLTFKVKIKTIIQAIIWTCIFINYLQTIIMYMHGKSHNEIICKQMNNSKVSYFELINTVSNTLTSKCRCNYKHILNFILQFRKFNMERYLQTYIKFYVTVSKHLTCKFMYLQSYHKIKKNKNTFITNK